MLCNPGFTIVPPLRSVKNPNLPERRVSAAQTNYGAMRFAGPDRSGFFGANAARRAHRLGFSPLAREWCETCAQARAFPSCARMAAARDLRSAEGVKRACRLRFSRIQRRRRVTYQPRARGSDSKQPRGLKARNIARIERPGDAMFRAFSPVGFFWGAGFLGLQPRLVCYAPLAL